MPQKRGAKQCTSSPLPLWDCPHPWLMQLPKHMDSSSLLALFQSCKKGLALMLRSSDCTNIHLPVLQRSASIKNMLSALHLASEQDANVKLHLTGWHDESLHNLQREGDFGDVAYRQSCIMLQAGKNCNFTQNITGLQLEALSLPSLLPEILRSCPNVTSLVLKNITLQAADGSDSHAAEDFSKLHTLQLENVYCMADAEAWAQALELQMVQCTGRRSLLIINVQTMPDEAVDALLLSVSKHLTHLYLDGDDFQAGDDPAWDQFSSLQQLELPDTTVIDDDMPWLLGMPKLTKLHVLSFDLEQSHAGQACTWTELSCHVISTDDLLKLPLHSNLLLKVNTELHHGQLYERGTAHVSLKGCASQVQAAIANASKCKDVHWPAGGVYISGGASKTTGDLLVEGLPVLKGVRMLYLGHMQLARQDVDALRGYLEQSAALTLSIKKHCTIQPADAVCLVTAMPAGSVLELYSNHERITAAMKACNGGSVQLQVQQHL